MRKLLPLLFLLICNFAFATDSTLPRECYIPTTVVSTQGIPTSIVAGHVSVISGDFCDTQTDIVIAGPDPLVLQRSYTSSNDSKSFLCRSWQLNHPQEMVLESIEKKDHRGREYNEYIAYIGESFGSMMKYDKLSPKQSEFIELSWTRQRGFTNCYRGVISAKHNPKNNKVKIKYNNYCEVTSGGGDFRHFNKSKSNGYGYDLSFETRANGRYFSYRLNEINFLEKIEAFNKKNGVRYAFVNIPKENYKNFKKVPQFEVYTSDNRMIRYSFLIEVSQRENVHWGSHYLSKVTSTHRPEECYTYKNGRVVKKSLPDRRFIEVEYYQGRVKTIKAPVGSIEEGAKPIITHQFLYNFEKQELRYEDQGHTPSKGWTEVYDAYMHRTTYRYSFDKLTSIEKHSGKGTSGPLYSKEKYEWGKDSQEGYLLSNTLEDEKGKQVITREYKYDDRGNVECETLKGDLSGKGGVESYSKHYRYEKNQFNNLSEQWEDNGLKVKYTYLHDSNLVASKFTYEGSYISKRQFYIYDDNRLVVKEIVDDGNSADSNDLARVRFRQVNYYENNLTVPCYGLQLEKKECFYNPASGTEELVRRTCYEYYPDGNLKSEKVYDHNSNLLLSKFWEVDPHGNVIKETNANGETIVRRYDDNDNLIFEQSANPGRYKHFHYDFANRLVSEEEFHSDGTVLKTEYRYDYLGNVIAITDPFGNVTTQEFDEFGRMISCIQPPVEGANGANQIYKTFKYDILNNQVEQTNTLGEKIRTRYNIRNKPVKIEYPDGTKESYLYNLDGTLAEAIEKNGTKVRFVYDCFGRVKSKEKISQLGVVLSTHIYCYDAFKLVSEIDPQGFVTLYTYDYQGRKKSQYKGGRTVYYKYDSLDRVSQVTEDNAITAYEYDPLNRLKSECIMDQNLKIFKWSKYSYDIDGNRSEESVHTDKGWSVTHIDYDTHGKPVKIIDPLRYETLFKYDYSGSGLETTKIDPLGKMTIVTENAYGKEKLLLQKSPQGQILYSRYSFYDNRLNLSQRKENASRTITTVFEFNAMNQLVSHIEACGVNEEKKTTHLYNAAGQKEFLVKPDGTTLQHFYDDLGRLSEISSSDGTIHYKYRYDRNDNIICVKDLVNHTECLRTYNQHGNVLSETLPTGLTTLYEYDEKGRMIRCTLPDKTQIEYQHNPAYMDEVKRISTSGEQIYRHRYQHDTSGKVLKEYFGNGLFAEYSYNMRRELELIDTPHWKQKLSYDPVGNLKECELEDSMFKRTFSYTYDDLYQLTSENGVSEHTYESDGFNNRTMKDGVVYELNDLHQLKKEGDREYTYDLNGNMIGVKSPSGERKYEYDAFNRLIKATVNGEVFYYGYDSFNRRVYKSKEQGKKESYLYVGYDEIGTVNEEGKIVELRILGEGKQNSDIGATIAIEIDGNYLFPLHDHNGNIVFLDKHGECAAHYYYSAFGEKITRDGFAKIPWGFSSKRLDDETGFILFGRRYYAPDIGRWITCDPKGYIDGPNLYAYVHNNPLTNIDLYGLYSSPTPFEDSGHRPKPFKNRLDHEPSFEHNRRSKERARDREPNVFFSDTYQNSFFGGRGSKVEHFGDPSKYPGHVGVGYMNGIGTKETPGLINLTHLRSFLPPDYPVDFIHNNTTGFAPADILRCYLSKLGLATCSVNLGHEVIDSYFSAYPDGSYVMYCHSEASTNGGNVLNSCNPAYRDRVTVLGFNPSGYNTGRHGGNFEYFASTRDIVPRLFDPFGRMLCKDNIHWFEPHPDAPLNDHSFTSKTLDPAFRFTVDTYILRN